MNEKKISIAVIPGDGIGPEVINAALLVLDATKSVVPIHYELFPFGADHYLSTGETLPEKTFLRFESQFQGILTGAFGDPRIPNGAHSKELILGLRRRLDLFINFRPVHLLDERLSPLKTKGLRQIKFDIFRENTEGLYAGIGGKFKAGTDDEIAIEEMIVTRKGVQRIIRHAFEFANRAKRRRVTLVDKSNVLKFGHEIWLRTFKEVAKEFPNIESKHLYVDAAAMMLVRNPEEFDVIVTENMFGDILSDLGAELQGGMGFAPSVSYHPGKHAYFEPVHGSAPEIAGLQVANPIAAILTISILLSHFGYQREASLIIEAVKWSLENGFVSKDVVVGRGFGSAESTISIGNKIAAYVKAKIGDEA
jgi:3-isopropylmalate dehydrogenase